MPETIRLQQLLLFLFFIITLPGFAQHTDKSILLKGIDTLPLPHNANALPTFIIGTEPQIVVTMQYKAESLNQVNAIVTSRLQKGRIVVFGVPVYFTLPLINNTNVRRLMLNTLKWADQKKTRNVQLWGDSLSKKLLLQNGYHIITLPKHRIGKTTGIIILTDDITDLTEQKNLEAFIRAGGTLIYGSAFNQFNYNFKLNNIFTKAGLYLTDDPADMFDNKQQFITGDIPSYLHISTILDAIETNKNIPWAQDQLDNMTTCINLVLSSYPLTSPLVIRIRKLLCLDETQPIVPSEQHPLSRVDWRTYFIYRLQQKLKQQQAITKPVYTDPAASTFPGAVADSAARINTSLIIPVHVGTQGLWDGEPEYFRLHSTGLYVPAGEKVTVIINPKDIAQHLKAQIGIHDDDLSDLNAFTRTPADLTRSFELGVGTTTIYSPFGGLLYIKIADTSKLKSISIQVNGAVKCPYFKMGSTSLAQWRSIRKYDAPWAELATDKIILTVPASRIRYLDDPEKLMKFWDEVMDADAQLAAISPQRIHPERMVADVAVAYGAMFTTFFKCVVPDNIHEQATINMLDEAFMRREGSWGHFHELGHRHQFWPLDFEGNTEVTVNLFTMYVYDKVLGKGIYNHPPNILDKQHMQNDIRKYMASSPSLEKWKSDPFLALRMYMELIDAFGWGPIEQVYKNYRVLPQNQYPKTDAQKRDLWFTQISNATQKNLSQFFDKWKIPITDKAKNQVSNLPVWLPDELK